MKQQIVLSILLITTVHLELFIAVSINSNATTSYNSNNIAFELPDLTQIIGTTEGEYQLEAYKSVLNDEILKSKDKSRNSQLFWVSLGSMKLLRDIKATNTSGAGSIFRATHEGYYAYISSLTEYHRKQLAEAASLKYNTRINTSQIVNLILSEFTCIMSLYTAEGRKMIVRGEVTSFQRYPLRMDFLMPSGSQERRLFEQRILLTSQDRQLTLKCKVSSSGQKLKTNTLVINWELSNQLGITDELFGPIGGSGDTAVTVTREQLARLSAELYSTLSVQETYEMPQTQFTDSFIQDLLKQVAPKGISPMSVELALNLLSKYSIDFGRDLRPDEIVRDIGSILKVEKFGNKSRIILDKASFQQLITKNKISGGGSASGSYMGVIKIGGSAKFARDNELNSEQSDKSLDDQLRELNIESTDDIKWKLEGTRVVPKSLNVARIIRGSFQRTLVFQRIRRQFTDAAFRRSFALYATDAGTPPDALAALHTAVRQVRSEMTAGVSALQGHVTQLRAEMRALRSELQSAVSATLANKASVTSVLQKVDSVRAKMAPLFDSSHCILANGACPAGYTRHECHMSAIQLYSGSEFRRNPSVYITQATFGSSRISCHGTCGQYGDHIGELHLAACCK